MNLLKLILTSIVPIFLLATIPANAATAATPEQINCLARVIEHEAGGEPVLGQKAVGYVVLNRLKSPKWPKSICDVVKQPRQFSNFTTMKHIPRSRLEELKALAFTLVMSYSSSIDPTRGSTYFHNIHVRPNWGGMIFTARIGSHIFYRSAR